MPRFHSGVNRVVDGLHVALRTAATNDEVVRIADDRSDVELDEVERLVVLGQRSDRLDNLLGTQRYNPCSAM